MTRQLRDDFALFHFCLTVCSVTQTEKKNTLLFYLISKLYFSPSDISLYPTEHRIECYQETRLIPNVKKYLHKLTAVERSKKDE